MGHPVMKNLFDVLRDKENQIKELHAEIKRVEDQIEKLRAAANILSDEGEPSAAPQSGQTTAADAASAAVASRGSASTTKRWMP